MAKRKEMDTTDFQVGQPGIVDVPSTGDAMLIKPDIKPVDGPEWKEKAAMLAFMEEPVEVVVHTSTDKNAEPIVEVFNDGRVQRFIRGQKQTVKRKFVEVLARAKVDSFGNEAFTNDEGIQGYRHPKSVSLRYPFSVVNDSTRGQDWLQKVLAEPS